LNDLLVMKFGGTSMGSAERIRIAARIASQQKTIRPTVVVVSAMSKVTDLLLDTLRHAEAGARTEVDANIEKLRNRHIETCHSLLDESRQEQAVNGIEGLLAEFDRISQGILMLGVKPPRSVDEAIAIGERLSAHLLALYLESIGIPAVPINGGEVIVTDAVFGNANPCMPETKVKAARTLLPLLESGTVPIVTGFNGATVDGRPTTLGRGGSDFSASILAAALDASELWIWTDVDGIMTADPRLVKNAAVLDEVTYNEAAELAYNGAKVLHPRTLAPLAEKGIPVWSKNSFALDKPGTRIAPLQHSPHGPKAVTSMANVALVSIEPANTAVNGTQIMARALDSLARANAEVLAFSSSSYRQSFCFLVRREELSATLANLEAGLALELAHGYVHPLDVNMDVGLVAVVGEGMQGTQGVAGRIFTAISREKVNIIAIAQGSSELTIAIIVAKSGLENAVRAVHEECGMGL
jgi:aspartokinase/homoserine dehydrogenase 1